MRLSTSRRPSPALFIMSLVFTAALGGYLWFVVTDQRDPVPTRIPASFGVGFDAHTDPSVVMISDPVEFQVRDLDKARVDAWITVPLRSAGGLVDPSDEALYFAVPPACRLGKLSTELTARPDDPEPVEEEIGFNSIDLRNDSDLAEPIGKLNGEEVTVISGRGSSDGPSSRLLRLPLPARWTRLDVSLELTAPSRSFLRPTGRIGERALALEFGTTDAIPRAVLGARSLQDFASGTGTAKLKIDVDYSVSLVETRFDSVPTATAMDGSSIIWTEDVMWDGQLRVDGYISDETTRYWLKQLDTLVLLLFGGVLGALVNQVATARS